MKGEFFIEEFQLINEDSMLKLEYHYFAAQTEIMQLGNDYQWLLNYQVKINQLKQLVVTKQKYIQPDVVYFLMWYNRKYIHLWSIFAKKRKKEHKSEQVYLTAHL